MPDEHFVTATLYEYIEPLDRGERYEDLLDEVLTEHGLGEICGGGSMMSDSFGIEYVDIEIQLTDLQRGLPIIVDTLESRGAPIGSLLRYSLDGEDQMREFGVAECVAIVLDGTTLPDEVYESSDINDMISEMVDAIEDAGELRSWWEGPTDTVLYFFGHDAEQLWSVLQPVVESYDRCQNARIILRHGHDKLNPRSIQIPRDS
ncbi:MAG: hypothetical protein R3C59_06740 [Planctomycetaceae bacterium]